MEILISELFRAFHQFLYSGLDRTQRFHDRFLYYSIIRQNHTVRITRQTEIVDYYPKKK
jgi:hypothetical protein